MEPPQIHSIYCYVRDHTADIQHFNERLAVIDDGWNEPAECLLYLPMFSMGKGPGTIMPRVDYLRQTGWGVERLGHINEADKKSICDAKMSNGARFGFDNQFHQVTLRASQIIGFGIGQINEKFRKQVDWSAKDLFHALMILQEFEGVGSAAALHVLMELNWGVVKPDRHICRFLSRLGGRWSNYFAKPGTDTLLPEGSILFLEEWRDACGMFSTYADEGKVNFEERELIAGLTPRQIDRLIMWYMQDVMKSDRAWRPQPICTSMPKCEQCQIEKCASRRRN